MHQSNLIQKILHHVDIRFFSFFLSEDFDSENLSFIDIRFFSFFLSEDFDSENLSFIDILKKLYYNINFFLKFQN